MVGGGAGAAGAEQRLANSGKPFMARCCRASRAERRQSEGGSSAPRSLARGQRNETLGLLFLRKSLPACLPARLRETSPAAGGPRPELRCRDTSPPLDRPMPAGWNRRSRRCPESALLTEGKLLTRSLRGPAARVGPLGRPPRSKSRPASPLDPHAWRRAVTHTPSPPCLPPSSRPLHVKLSLRYNIRCRSLSHISAGRSGAPGPHIPCS